ncbi:MAG TPA: membrane protein insertase YidC [Geobacteraceae bacterium]
MEKRVVIAIVLSVAVMYGYSYLVPQPQPQKMVQAKAPSQQAVTVQSPAAAQPQSLLPAAQASVQPAREVVVDTDLYRAVFSSRGGTLKSLLLKKYHDKAGPGGKEVALVAEQAPENFTLRSEAQGFAVDPAAVCSVNTDGFTVGKGEKRELEFICAYQGTTLKKSYTIRGDSYGIDLNQQLVNTGTAKQEGVLRLVLTNQIPQDGKESRFEQHGPVTLAGKGVVALKVKDLEKGQKSYGNDVRWTGYADKYFLSVVMAGTGSIGADTIRENKGYIENSISSLAITLNPGESFSLPYKLYFGPKDLDILKAQGNQLEEVIDLGWFSAVAKPLLYSLKFLYRYVHNYGIAIIIITVVIKFLFYPLTYKSYKSMKEMQKLQPKMAELKEKYKNDRDALNKAIMDLYQTHKVNPLGGCLPMLVQMPIFIALYRALMSSIELRHAPFMLWIQDLAAKDPYYVTPIVMGATMFIQQKMTPSASMDPTQAKMMMMLPVVFTVMFINMPAGLVVYWLVNNILTIAQQAYINRLLKE